MIEYTYMLIIADEVNSMDKDRRKELKEQYSKPRHFLKAMKMLERML